MHARAHQRQPDVTRLSLPFVALARATLVKPGIDRLFLARNMERLVDRADRRFYFWK
jgi:hypothetical protein